MISTEIQNASNIMLGSQEAEALYIGSNLIWQQSSPLPYDAEIEYLECNGLQWIDTGFTPTVNTRVQFKFKNTHYSGDVVIGYFNDSDIEDWRFFTYQGNPYFDIPGGTVSGQRIVNNNFTLVEGDIYELELGNFYIKDLTTNQNIDGVSTRIFTANDTIKLNYCNKNKQISSNVWYYVKIYESDVLVLDLIPVRVGQIGYMYDKISKQLFANQGTGDFILGPDKT